VQEWRKLGFRVRVSVKIRAPSRSSVLITSFKDVINFLCFEWQLQPLG